MRFKDKVVLIIGGNSGIGRAAAIDFGKEGAHVFITGRAQATIDETVAQIPGARGFVADIGDIDSGADVLDAIRQAHGRIDILFVNAGIGTFKPAAERTFSVSTKSRNANATSVPIAPVTTTSNASTHRRLTSSAAISATATPTVPR